MSYALCAPSVADAKVQTVCRERILAAADQELKRLEPYAYRVPYTGVGGRPLRYPPCKSWPDLRLFADVGWLPILSEFSVSSTMLHTVFLYGGGRIRAGPASDSTEGRPQE